MSVFFLGTHKPHWLTLSDVPMFLSHNVLKGFKALPRAKGPWSLDSGGFTELNTHGRWTVPPREYAEAVRRPQVAERTQDSRIVESGVLQDS